MSPREWAMKEEDSDNKNAMAFQEHRRATLEGNRFQRIGRGIGALSLGAMVSILGQLSLVPIAMWAWGATRYGEWVVLTGLVTFLGISDLGLQTYVVNVICQNYARGNLRELLRVLHSTLKLQIPMISGILGLLAVILYFVPLSQLLRLHTIHGWELIVVVLLLATELLLGVPMGIIAGLYRATGRLARAAMIGACSQFALLALTVTLIAFKTSFLLLAVSRISLILLYCLVILWDLRRLYPWLSLWPSSGSWLSGLKMVAPGVVFLLIPMADYLCHQVTLMIIQKVVHGAAVSRLATHRTVVNFAAMASVMLTTAMEPEITMLHASGHKDTLVRLHHSLAKLNLWLVASVALAMLPAIYWIYPLWTARQLTLDGWTLAILEVRMLVWSVWRVSMVLLMAINRPKPVAIALFSSAIVTGLLAAILIPWLGIRGDALAELIGDLSVAAWLIPVLASREIGDQARGFLQEMGLALGKGVSLPLVLGALAWILFTSTWVRYLVIIPMSLCLLLILLWQQSAVFERRSFLNLARKAGGKI